MKEMNVQQLQEYLKHAIDVEMDVATQEEIIAYNEAQLNSAKPQEPVLYTATQPQVNQEKSIKGRIIGCVVGYNLGGLLGALLAFLIDALSDTSSIPEVAYILWALSIIGILIAGYKIGSSYDHKQQGEDSKLLQEYQELRTKVEKENKASIEKHMKQLKLWETHSAERRQALSAPLAQTRALLEKLYSADVIYPKYRTLPALTSIYEYLITGRCDTLTGPHGAYNLYEDEVRKDMVITQLSQVVANLESIKNTQYQLYQQVSQMNQTTSAIAMELQQIKGCAVAMTELAALNLYYTQRNERHNRIASYCDVLEIL